MEFFASLGRRRVVTAVVALLVAFGAGILMQHILVDGTPMATVDELPDAAPSLRSAGQSPGLPTPPAATLVPMLPPPPVLPDRVDNPGPVLPEVWDDARMSPFGFNCDPELSLTLGKAAMIEARLFAPCDQGQRVTFRHGALEIDMVTDPFGRAATMMPALDISAGVAAILARETVSSQVRVSDARAFSRVVLVWEGPQHLQMNAYELGARRGESGHIRAGRAKTPSRAERGTGGFLVNLGDGSGRSAEVYSFPTGHSPLRGIVELIVEADVTKETCGRMARATALQTSPLGGMTTTDVRVTLPDCDRVGDVIELKNLLQDMRLAGR